MNKPLKCSVKNGLKKIALVAERSKTAIIQIQVGIVSLRHRFNPTLGYRNRPPAVGCGMALLFGSSFHKPEFVMNKPLKCSVNKWVEKFKREKLILGELLF